MAELEGIIDLKCLENELKAAIDSDKLYWLQNNVKKRAVTEVSSYEEFVDRVAAAHLRPLDPKTDRIKSDNKVVWNPNCSRRKANEFEKDPDLTPMADQDFARGYNRLQDKLHLLESPEMKYK